MKTEQQFISDIYKKYDEYTEEKQIEKKKKMKKMQKIINMAAVVIVLFSSIIVFSGRNEKRLEKNSLIEDMKLDKIGSFEKFYQIMKEKNVVEKEATIKSDVALESASNALDTNYKTNTQVENVDEADIVKTDGKYFYYVADKKVVIIDAQKRENSNKLAEISFEEGFYPSEIYLGNNKLIVILSEIYDYDTCKTAFAEETNDIMPLKSKTGMVIYDLSNINEPKESRRVMVQGNYVSSRLIENKIYFVANQYIYTSQMKNNTIENLNENDYKPKYEDSVIGKKEKCINFDEIYNLSETNDSSYLTLVGLDIEKEEEADIKTFLGAGQYIYSSEKNMYIAINKEKYEAESELISSTVQILKFALKDARFIFVEQTNLEGRVNNQFSMDENGKYFRIATTVGKVWNIDENTSNNLYVLDEQLKEVGKMTGFAKEEKIYSVRYVKDKAYIVTFKQTDPLFVIDLSNPSRPQITGELKLPGYSTYLHPYDETHIIGFGYETKENGRFINTDGIKMVMFDVSDINNPQVLFKVNIGDKYTSSNLLYEHKALLFSKEKNIIAFPANSYLRGKTNSRALIYEIDFDEGFVLKGEIKNVSDKYSETIERVAYAGNTYFTFSKDLVKLADMNTFEIIKEIEL